MATQIEIVCLGVIGARNLALNMERNGYTVAGYESRLFSRLVLL